MLSRRILQARYVFPVAGEPIENGFVAIEKGRIAEVGTRPSSGERIELGNVAILPGLINAHAHLEFSGLSQPLGTPGMGFVDWIRGAIAWRRGQDLDSKPLVAAGLKECARHGVTTVGNISQPDETENAYRNAEADGTRFFEIIAPKIDFLPQPADFLQTEFSRLLQAEGAADWQMGLSPHAPYSVHPELLQSIAAFSSVRECPLAMHLAESREEMQLLEEGAGPFRDFLEERNIFDPGVFPGGKHPLDYLKILAAAARVLIVHGNYLNDAEIAFLAAHADRMAVAYCPRTHAYFRHDPYPLEKMLAAGVTVALGTDSRASSPDLSLLAEMRFAAKRYPQIDRKRILELGTIDAARALGRENEIGTLKRGKTANLAVVALSEDKSGNPYQLLFETESPVVQTWFRGQRVG
jgi:aminodeoxyfutalosine deaminase